MTHLERLQTSGIRRVGTPESGFHYVYANGKPVAGRDLERCKALVLPPAWTDVRIHTNERAHLQAVGKDKAGRWQYRYHERFRSRQDARKYERILDFAEALPRMRVTVNRHIRQPGMGREKVMACILKVLSTCFIRPGSQVYAAENGSYGIATLRRKHVRIHGDVVHFSFRGKSGKQQERELKDRQAARIIRELVKMPGVEIFKFLDEDGKVVDVKRRHINEYIKEVMGDQFSAKDFRTWAGTLIAACALARSGTDATDSKTARKKKVIAAVKEAAATLGNTPAICRASYIYPSVLSSFDRGRTVDRYFQNVEELVQHRGTGLHATEKALLEFLKEEVKQHAHQHPSARRRESDRSGPEKARHRERATRKTPARRAQRKPSVKQRAPRNG